MAQKQIVPRDLNYETNNAAFDEQNNDAGFKCKNYEVCGTVLPDWWWDCKSQYVCSGCDMMFGTWGNKEGDVHQTGKGELGFADNIECPVCLEVKRGVTYPNCDHYICIKCFKRCFYGDKSGRQPFPYPSEVMDEWENDRDNPRWDIEYPLIKPWDEADTAWLDNHELQYEKEEHLRQCPLCRK